MVVPADGGAWSGGGPTSRERGRSSRTIHAMNLSIALVASGILLTQQPTDPTRGELGEGVPEGFVVRPGYKVTLVAEDLEEARFVEFGGDGELYVSMPRQGKIQSLRDGDGDGSFETRADFVVDQSNCHTMRFHEG